MPFVIINCHVSEVLEIWSSFDNIFIIIKCGCILVVWFRKSQWQRCRTILHANTGHQPWFHPIIQRNNEDELTLYFILTDEHKVRIEGGRSDVLLSCKFRKFVFIFSSYDCSESGPKSEVSASLKKLSITISTVLKVMTSFHPGPSIYIIQFWDGRRFFSFYQTLPPPLYSPPKRKQIKTSPGECVYGVGYILWIQSDPLKYWKVLDCFLQHKALT